MCSRLESSTGISRSVYGQYVNFPSSSVSVLCTLHVTPQKKVNGADYLVRTRQLRVYPRLSSVSVAIAGVENRVTTIVFASATARPADVRVKGDIVGMWSTGCRHGFERIRHASMPTACGLMTGGSPRKRWPSSEPWKSHSVTDVRPDCEAPPNRQRGSQRPAWRALIGFRPRSSSRSSDSRPATARRWWHEPRCPAQAPALPPAGRPSRWRLRARR